MSNENEVENTRREIVAEITARLVAAGAEITNQSLGLFIEEAYPGFNFDPVLDGPAAVMNATEAADGEAVDENSPDVIREKVRELDQRAADLRIEIRAQTDAVRNARGVLGQAIADFQHGIGPKLTPQDLIRQHLAASVAERQRRKDGHDPEPSAAVAGPSFLDRQSQRYGDGETFARKQHKTGHSRGAYPSSMRGARVTPPSVR